jgi:hypothetical protein
MDGGRKAIGNFVSSQKGDGPVSRGMKFDRMRPSGVSAGL